MEGCFSCFYYNAKKEVSCLERRKKQILDKIACLQRDIVYAEEDQEKHERLIARHQALRRSLRTELRELAENVDELHQSHDNLSSQVQESKLQLEEIGAARDRLKDQVAAEALELQVVEVECKRASLDLESAREEKEQVEAQVMRQREENDALRAEYERASMEAATIRAKMMAAKEETDEATKALKDLIEGLGTLTSAPPKVLTIDANHERLTRVLVTGPPEVVKVPVPSAPGRADLLSPRARSRCSPDSSTPVHGSKTPRTPSMMPKFRGKSLSPPFRSGSGVRSPTPVTARSPTPTSGPPGTRSASEGPPSAGEDAVSQARRCLREIEKQHGFKSKQAMNACTELALQLEEFTPATKEAGQLLRRAFEGSIEMFGKDDLQTLTTVNNLAVYLDNIGEKEEALGLYRWARDGRLKQLGPSHPYTLDSTYNLACFLLYDNQLAEAWQAFTEARDGCVECFGWNHQGTLDCTERMVDILEAEGKLDEAVQLCKELLSRSQDMQHSKDNPQKMRALVTLGSLLAAAGRMSEAEPCFRQAVEECSRTFGADDPYTIDAIFNLAVSLEDQGKLSEAEKHYKAAADGRTRAFGTDHVDTLHAEQALMMCRSAIQGQ
ncbi:unnamed protein product [Durusdinium trenchii]|uniref:Kinesin light chain n=2 Tax=Durusdinium trenchii TaxID=1381693 RepID=A0ABP0I2P2_9DINO